MAFKEGFHEKRRQEFKDIYIRSGLIYVIKTEVLFQILFMGRSCTPTKLRKIEPLQLMKNKT